MTDDDKALVERLRHCSENCGDEYLHELTGRGANRIEALSAEIERLREALTQIKGYSEINGMTRQRMKRIARAALGDTK